MRIKYNQEYWDNYYDGSYEETFRFAFNARQILRMYEQATGSIPTSFADIGAGPGLTLKDMEVAVPGIKVYGVECQDIPKDRVAHSNIHWGDFTALSSKLPEVDLLYCSCSMYVPWEQQEEFLSECLRLSKHAILFGNVYLEDGDSIPEDLERVVIYNNREAFRRALEATGSWKRGSVSRDFFVRS